MLVFCSLQFSLKSNVYYPVLFIYDTLQYSLCTWATTSSLMGAVKTAGSGSEEEASVIKNQKSTHISSSTLASGYRMDVYGGAGGHSRWS